MWVWDTGPVSREGEKCESETGLRVCAKHRRAQIGTSTWRQRWFVSGAATAAEGKVEAGGRAGWRRGWHGASRRSLRTSHTRERTCGDGGLGREGRLELGDGLAQLGRHLEAVPRAAAHVHGERHCLFFGAIGYSK